jgi:hypothetical protein
LEHILYPLPILDLVSVNPRPLVLLVELAVEEVVVYKTRRMCLRVAEEEVVVDERQGKCW